MKEILLRLHVYANANLAPCFIAGRRVAALDEEISLARELHRIHTSDHFGF